jgi:heme-degrading monooxygenase HmoA
MQVRAGCEQEFREAWQSYAPRIARHRGSRGQALAVQAGRERTYVITGDWADRQSLAAFESSADRRELSAALDALRESAGKTVLEVVVVVPANAEESAA